MKDNFSNYAQNVNSPLFAAEACPDASDCALSEVSRAVHIGVPGDLEVTMLDGTRLVIPGLASGWHPIRISHIWAAGSTAQSVVAFA